jgi:hypothetical protein
MKNSKMVFKTAVGVNLIRSKPSRGLKKAVGNREVLLK